MDEILAIFARRDCTEADFERLKALLAELADKDPQAVLSKVLNTHEYGQWVMAHIDAIREWNAKKHL